MAGWVKDALGITGVNPCLLWMWGGHNQLSCSWVLLLVHPAMPRDMVQNIVVLPHRSNQHQNPSYGKLLVEPELKIHMEMQMKNLSTTHPSDSSQWFHLEQSRFNSKVQSNNTTYTPGVPVTLCTAG